MHLYGNLPKAHIVQGQIAGKPVMIARLSFSGERAYEVYTPSGHGLPVWQSVIDAGKVFDIAPYGIEALDTLRIEKGHLTAGEIDGRTTACNLGLGWALSKQKPFVRKVLMERPGLHVPQRLQLVGLVSEDGQPISGGAHLTQSPARDVAMPSLGHVSSACFSPTIGKPIALALLGNGSSRVGQTIWQSDPMRNRFGKVQVVSPQFVDPKGERLNG